MVLEATLHLTAMVVLVVQIVAVAVADHLVGITAVATVVQVS
jgi:hypothetical protein